MTAAEAVQNYPRTGDGAGIRMREEALGKPAGSQALALQVGQAVSPTSVLRIVPSARLIWMVAAIGFPGVTIAALWPAAWPAVIVILAGLAAAIAADAAMRGRALESIRVDLPDVLRFFKDRDGQIRMRVSNATAQARRLRIGMVAPDGIETDVEEKSVDLPAGAKAFETIWTWTPRRRGRYLIEACYLEASSPLGMWSVRRLESVALEIRVYPNLRRDDDFKALNRGLQGLHSLRQVGRGREFEKLREYVPGDGYDELHWKASARRGRPITKVFQVERTQEVYVVIDASRLSARPVGQDTALERAIATTLVVGAAAERRGDLFGLAAFSNQVEAFARARNGKVHYAACRDAIYQLQPRPVSPDFDEIATFLRLRLRRRALLVFLTSLDDPVLAESFVRATKLLARRHLVLAGMPRPDSAQPLFHGAVESVTVETSNDIYRHLAGHLAWKHLRELEATLARQGVQLTLIEPEKLSSGVMRLYDDVKQRQLL